MLTIPNIMFAIGIISVIFSVFLYFRNPQEAIEKRQEVSEATIREKAKLLAQQLEWEKESTDKRFAGMQDDIKEATTLAQNHIHTIDVRLTDFTELQAKRNEEFSNSFMRLFTILEERLPIRKEE